MSNGRKKWVKTFFLFNLAFEAYATDMSGHPHTFPVFGVAHENEDLFIFTALLDDFVTLQKFLRQEHRSFGMKYNILLQLANVYAHMHGFGVNVRHISVEDVYINSNGTVRGCGGGRESS